MTGMVVVPVASPIKSLADLQGKRVAFGQPDSYEKHHAPLIQLASQGVKPASGSYFSSCGENLDALMGGTVDAAVISSYALTASCAVDFAKPEDFRVIARTAEMPLTSILVDLNKVPAAAATRLQQALLAVSGDKVPADLTGKGFVAPVSWRPVPVEVAAVPESPAKKTP
jgi:phosphonate transport system substrate-binding protein